MSKQKNIFYAQSGGPTAVINATAAGLIEAATAAPEINKIYCGRNGILGALNEELIDISQESPEALESLKHTPASAFGSCRYKLKCFKEDDTEYRRIIEVFKAHDIGYFFYNGGNDSQDTTYKISEMSKRLGYPLTCIGLPKTIDNDLVCTDNCPGFGSAAKYVAISMHEGALDVASMCETSTKVFVFEVMGRHAGWIAAATGLASHKNEDKSQLILFPEIPFNQDVFLKRVDDIVKTHGFCSIAVSEGVKDEEGNFLSDGKLTDAFGHEQLGGGVGPWVAQSITKKLGYKHHWAVADYLQRSARHIASQTDFDQAYTLGHKAIEFALLGKNNVMLNIERISDTPYQWQIGTAPLEDIPNKEKKMPRDFISEDGFHITKKCREYLTPLISGEAYPPYEDGLPQYSKLKRVLANKKLIDDTVCD